MTVSPHPGVSGHADPEGEAPWAMQLVALVDKDSAATHLDVCTAAARAVVLLLTDLRAHPEGPWAPAVTRWTEGRIRKVVRRARSARWDTTAALDHVSAEFKGATVRAFVPGPTDQVPTELSRLQVSGLDLPHAAAAAAAPGGVVVALTSELALSTGKAAAQAGHAAQVALLSMAQEERDLWARTGFALRVIEPAADEWRLRTLAAPVQIRDAGFTEIPSNSLTALAWWS